MRIALALLGVALAAVIPIVASRFGVSVFWSQALGILIGSLPMMIALTRRALGLRKIAVPWAIAVTVATLVALAAHRVLG